MGDTVENLNPFKSPKTPAPVVIRQPKVSSDQLTEDRVRRQAAAGRSSLILSAQAGDDEDAKVKSSLLG